MRDLGENGLSDYDGMDEDEAFPPLPPPHSPGQGGSDKGDAFGEEEGDVSKLAEVPAARRKGVRRPQPKLDSQRLISDRGLPALRTMFDNVHFKGKGHEAPNDVFVPSGCGPAATHAEDGELGPQVTCLKRIRLDMPLTDEDFIGKDGEDAGAAPELPVFSDPDPDPFSGSSFPDDLEGPIHSTPAPAAPPAPSPAPPSLTEEQRRRMEMNRQKALERRLARQQQQQTTIDSQTVDTPTSGEEPTSLLNGSDHQSEEMEEVKGLDLELVDSSSRAEGAEQPLNKDSEPSAESSQPEEEETQTKPTHQASDRGEDGE
ncbi:hypothetical protein INR49_020138 [Caranx melampygus]|nr:hypothetical protein INR49_020138 [Caranx melampygus]